MKIGVDIGGTKTLILSEDSKRIQFLTPKKSSKEFYDKVSKGILNMGSNKAGISFAGVITKKGMVTLAPNIPKLEDTNFISEFKKRGIEIIIGNDANCFALAKSKEFDVENLVGIIIGTGVGAGIIINNKIYSGNSGYAGEIGHGKIFDGKEYEDLIAGASFDSKNATKDQLKSWHHNLSRLVSQVCYFYNPEIIVFGGGLTNILDLKFLKKNILKMVDEEVLKGTKILIDNHIDVCAKGALHL
ncbi:hypothetical protein C0585_05735 [Candidatus Woesearchaeota archaeon]|nr:MAG: hypothetical protein C0585_05735 [Candidatus Woesearchaeota archaeon]